jgi:hypothetical protein
MAPEVLRNEPSNEKYAIKLIWLFRDLQQVLSIITTEIKPILTYKIMFLNLQM